MKAKYLRRMQYWLRFAGWINLLPASAYLYFYHMYQHTPIASVFMIELVIIVLFAAYLLATTKSERWLKPRRIMTAAIFSIFFVSLIVAIPLFVAYYYCRQYNNPTPY